ncbi:universal stress protein [Neorhodopirellula lusitana]|uniref:universal stress protein n=1 Tax=Neorhodopirellula lusitana TaxID=445327 RepID=UPI00384AFE69
MKILLAIDGSEQAAAATQFLARHPLPRPVEIEILTVVNPPDLVVSAQSEMWYPEFISHQEQLANHTLEAAKKALLRNLPAIANPAGGKSEVSSTEADTAKADTAESEEAEAQEGSEVQAANASAGLTIKTRREMGHIGHCIVDRAADGKFDLVVVAAKGHSALERVLMGSVSDYVATHAPCSVLIVRENAESGEAAESDGITNVTIAADQRGVSDTMLKHLCRYPFGPQYRFHVVTASVKLEVFREDILATTMEESARRRTEARRCAMAAAERLQQCDGQPCERSVTSDSIEVEHVGAGLVDYAEEHNSDLVVLGDSGRGAISRFFLGSTSQYVLHHVQCSVLLVREAS